MVIPPDVETKVVSMCVREFEDAEMSRSLAQVASEQAKSSEVELDWFLFTGEQGTLVRELVAEPKVVVTDDSRWSQRQWLVFYGYNLFWCNKEAQAPESFARCIATMCLEWIRSPKMT